MSNALVIRIAYSKNCRGAITPNPKGIHSKFNEHKTKNLENN